MEQTIEEDGESFNASQASSSPVIVPDLNRLKKYDIYIRKHAKIAFVSSIIALVLTSVAVYMWVSDYAVLAPISGLLSLLFLWFSRIVKRSVNGDAYETGHLMPAILVSVSPLELLVMADLRTSEETEETEETEDTEDAEEKGDTNDSLGSKDSEGPILGFKRMLLEELPCYSLQVGERVVCTGQFTSSDEEGWSDYKPRLLSWATADPTQLQAAKEAINEKEWQTLETAQRKMPAFDANKMAIYNASLELKEIV